ncbi:cellulose synthase complex outer membrane protein BcsC [Stutzerimonas stutzeri]|uniref:cellulose synthase complex outer membrane protein BcsC n=1 Tax=Stutzerimonas stutzeri TaxID=316 RepID=UPI001C2E5B0B|nr:cellulose synthase complex outer membrane protein BcsC [Stutzerimonas stutzeri]
MRRYRLMLVAAALPLWCHAQVPEDRADQTAWLLAQVRAAEAVNRDELVRDALKRLQLVSPGDSGALLAEMRLALRQRDGQRVAALQQALQQAAPGTEAERDGRILAFLSSEAGQQQLQQARLAAMAGRPDDALQGFRALYGDKPPTLELAVEYWRVRSAQPGQRSLAIDALRRLDEQYPGNPPARQLLANLLFEDGQDTAALAQLSELGRNPAATDAAAQREFEYLAARRIDDTSVKAWADFLQRYPAGRYANDARANLERSQRLLADPFWRAGQDGLRLLDRSQDAAAEAKLRYALRRYPNDPELLGGLGLALMRPGHRREALVYFGRAKEHEDDIDNLSKWSDLITSTRYWLTLEKADQALEQKRADEAASLYASALKQQPGSTFAQLGLAQVAEAQGRLADAEVGYQRLLSRDPGNASAIRGLLRLYQAQSPERALAFIDTLSSSQRNSFADLRNSLLLARYRLLAEQALERDDQPAAITALRQARSLAPTDPWLAYRLASSLQQQQAFSEADAVFGDLLKRQADDPVAHYAHALYLSGAGRDAQALASLHRISERDWDDDMHSLATRLERRELMTRIDKLRASGREAAAVELMQERLRKHGDSVDDLLALADWAAARGEPAVAAPYVERALRIDPAHPEARLMRIELLLAEGQTGAARQALRTTPPVLAEDDWNAKRRLANSWAAVGERDKARQMLQQIEAKAKRPDPLLRRDTARLLAEVDPAKAMGYYRQALIDADLLAKSAGTAELTQATRQNAADDWLVRSLRSDTAALHQRQDTTLTLQHDHGWRNDDGTPGISELLTDTTLLHLDTPMANGRGFLRAERLALDAGTLDANAFFGACRARNDCAGESQRGTATLLAGGWRNERLEADLGLTEGFEIDNLFGGVTGRGNLDPISWSLTASRRPMSNSLLSYGGARDPVTGTRWGAVTANGTSLGLSWDEGGAHGLWSSLGYHWLLGDNVASNSRVTAMAGYYYKLVDRPDERVRTGLTFIHFGYDKDLSGHTLGQGGYWSPQNYNSISVPVSYGWRNQDSSVLLESSIGWSVSQSNGSRDYPLASLRDKVAAIDPDVANQTSQGSTSRGFSYRVQGLFERRLSDHFVLGGGFSLLQSDEYAPSRAMLYLRYSFAPWRGDLALPIEPLVPYADFR